MTKDNLYTKVCNSGRGGQGVAQTWGNGGKSLGGGGVVGHMANIQAVQQFCVWTIYLYKGRL